ncbi:MAG: DUF5312 domain-containing protein [Treponema sp.]|nr:DUF5312 domain-containing protein [Treponema sp.]
MRATGNFDSPRGKMEEIGTMDRLVSSLSLTERKDLLSKLETQSLILKELLYQDADDSSFTGDAEERFLKLSIFMRIWYYILGLFKSQIPLVVFRNQEIVNLGREAEARAPGFYNAARGVLLPQFYEALDKLRNNSRFFYAALDSGFNRDKGAFYGFLASLEMEDIHARLVSDTDPVIIADRNPENSESVLRQTAQRNFEDIILTITEEQRGRMYANARSLVCLKQLSSFLYDRLIMAFTKDDDLGGMVCKVAIVRDALTSLNNTLFSLKECPSMSLLESLFIFILQDQGVDAQIDVHAETQKLLTQAEISIAAIQDFNRKIPLTLITRIAARDASVMPQALSGGEDWFLLYRDYWKRHIDSMFFAYFGNRRRRELQKSFADFFQGLEFKSLENAESETNPEGLPVLHADSLAFLLTFQSGVFMKTLNPFLRTVLIDGDFYKKDNKIEYTEYYNEIIKLDDVVKQFDANLSPNGEWGKRYAQTAGEMSALTVKRRKFQIIQEEIDEQARAIIERSGLAMNGLVNVLGGIISRESNGKYDTLSNLLRLNGKGSEFSGGLEISVQKLKEALKILKNIVEIENRK